MRGKKQKLCGICGKRLTLWTTSLIKYKGERICNSCREKTIREERDK